MRTVPIRRAGLLTALLLAAQAFAADAGPAASAAPAVVPAAASAPASGPPLRLRGDDDALALGTFGKAVLGLLAISGAGIWMVTAARRRGGAQAAARQARLSAVAHVRLGPKCTLHLVEADGQTVLVASGEQAHLVWLGPAPKEPAA